MRGREGKAARIQEKLATKR
ncbi:MAG: hypothetical protein MI750_02485 [Xanthomonadales bacterium]|nr:hypothetical protein [Xanthomonadales bacterium]